MAEKWQKEWVCEDSAVPYGDLFYKRSTGALPEMESSKAAAGRLQKTIRANDTVVDVGCGGGHYLRSLRRVIDAPFAYRGVDATAHFIDLAKKAYASDPDAAFQVGSIFDIPLPDRSGDIVMCNNVLLHLPSIAKPLAELTRVARRRLQIRTLISDKSYIIYNVEPQPDGNDFEEDGSPRSFHYMNIYSQTAVEFMLRRDPRVKSVSFELDRDFDPAAVSDTGEIIPEAWDKTSVLNGFQASGVVLLPWTWVYVDLES